MRLTFERAMVVRRVLEGALIGGASEGPLRGQKHTFSGGTTSFECAPPYSDLKINALKIVGQKRRIVGYEKSAQSFLA